MAIYLPNITACIETTCRNPSLLENMGLLLEDCMVRATTNHHKNSCCSRNVKSKENQRKEASSEPQEAADTKEKTPTLFDTLMKNVRQAMDDLQNDTKATPEDTKQIEIPKSQKDSQNTVDEVKEAIIPRERILPITTNNSSVFELKLNFEGCTADSVKLEVEDELLKATGKMAEDDGTKMVSFEKKLPADVDSSSLEAKFLEEGTLKITGKRFESIPTSKVM